MSVDNRKYTVEVEEEPLISSRSRKRALINHVDMKEALLQTGELVVLCTTADVMSAPFAAASVWPSLDIERGVVRIASCLSLTTRTISGDSIIVTPARLLPFVTPKHATHLVVLQTPNPSLHGMAGDSTIPQQWVDLSLKEILVDVQHITEHQVILLESRKMRLKFVIASGSDLPLTSEMEKLSINDVVKSQTIWRVDWNTEITIAPSPSVQSSSSIDAGALHDLVGGLTKQIDSLKELLDLPLSNPELFARYGLRPPRGILLFGPPGTGKTHLARSVASTSGASLLTISGPELSSAYHGETESKLRALFDEAKTRAPCIVVLDEIDAICPKREESGALVEARVVTTLLTLMDGMDSAEIASRPPARVVVLATTNRPNAIDPALRRPGRFDRELEIGVPDAAGRLSIFQVLLSKFPNSLTFAEFQNLASRTHGFVGADIAAGVRDAGTVALRRHLSTTNSRNLVSSHSSEPSITYNDLISSVSAIRPSALREHFVESPKVYWSDIGGQELVKNKLKECVEWPLLYPSAFNRLGITPPKGVLLYGPPGCSKTLTARALATESGINFISVKGPELLNKYVGESERSVREIFRKARAASPSIVFFDEIDALATSRSESEGQSSQQGVLTSLLTEMDGLQDLVGVIIVAATNRPQILDSALMRPGRLDRILYVGPPDLLGRKDILRIQTRKMAVAPDLDLEFLSSATEGCSGAEIVAMCQDAALHAMKADFHAQHVTQADFVFACQHIRRQITPNVIANFIRWRDSSGLPQA